MSSGSTHWRFLPIRDALVLAFGTSMRSLVRALGCVLLGCLEIAPARRRAKTRRCRPRPASLSEYLTTAKGPPRARFAWITPETEAPFLPYSRVWTASAHRMGQTPISWLRTSGSIMSVFLRTRHLVLLYWGLQRLTFRNRPHWRKAGQRHLPRPRRPGLNAQYLNSINCIDPIAKLLNQSLSG
jgi:hypothetical protein